MSVTVLTVLRDQSSHLIVQSDEESGRHVLSASELTQWLAGYLGKLCMFAKCPHLSPDVPTSHLMSPPLT